MKKISNILKLAKHHEIIRRYVIMNSFDGALTMLGIIIASFFAKIGDPFHVILPSFGAAVALMISGLWGAYAAETTETKKSIKTLENHLMRKLHGTRFMKKKYEMVLITSIINGATPMIVSLFILAPFLLATTGKFSMESAYYASLGFIGAILFNLGIFAGKISEEDRIINGVKMLFAGIVIGTIFYFFAIIGLL